MFQAASSRLISFGNTAKGFVTLGVVFLLFFLAWQYQTGIRVGDGAIKQQQVADLLIQGFPDFSCRYFGKNFDPEFRFLPLTIEKGATMAHAYKGKCYYVFPFYYALIQAPFVFLLGRFGSFLVSIIFGTLTLYSLYLLTRELKLGYRFRFLFLLFLLTGSTFTLFATDLSEYIISIGTVTYGFYFLFRDTKNGKTRDSIFAGLLFGFAAFFRQEVLLLAGSLSLAQAILKPKDIRLFWFPLSFGFLFLIQAIINYLVVGHPLGSRGYLQSFNSQEYDLLAQAAFLWELLAFGHGSLGLLGAYPILIFTWRYAFQKNGNRIAYIGILFFILFSAILTSTKFWQGVLFGPRFLLTVTPILLLYAIKSLEEAKFFEKKIHRILAIALLSYSIIGSVTYDVLYRKFTKSIIVERQELDLFSEKVIIYRNGSALFPPNSFERERMVFELSDEKEFDTLLNGLYKSGIVRFTMIGAKDFYSPETLIPHSHKFKISKITFKKSPSINMETVEFRPILK
ncbi:dolichyl-phosphate-mannose-protein mannosyltransferase [Leptospira broomii serovar Hurstbridge str. 5399]|uniref:Dolichyl-phosphate-mannose-protein mannosyltransferase n=1 Tax=Leptospira broomii serovar Hurstbridge str. 5399 TaxID=1049789 RepID=T0GIQ5_9LEPT|nr:membrane protein [Leptospira broomii]EQA46704.1 dolichyl-phosphate-mannose-protein mannosyltransferase [Leptospira broomii serovar Hurstbridge str. 5399]